LADELKKHFDADVQLIKSKGGVFEVTLDGKLVFSKNHLGRHAESGEVRRLIQSVVDQK
jgi:selT/selW/selH-like putative selenoprotein